MAGFYDIFDATTNKKKKKKNQDNLIPTKVDVSNKTNATKTTSANVETKSSANMSPLKSTNTNTSPLKKVEATPKKTSQVIIHSRDEYEPSTPSRPTLMTPGEITSKSNIKKQQESIQKGRELAAQKPQTNENFFGTVGNALKIFGQGAMKAEEGMFIDMPLGISATVGDISTKLLSKGVGLFSDSAANRILEWGSNYTNKLNSIAAQDWTANALDFYGWNKKLANGKTVAETMEDSSIIKQSNLGGKVVEGIGGMTPSILMGGAATDFAGLTTNGAVSGGASTLTAAKIKSLQSAVSYSSLGARSYGGAYEEAINNGGTTQQANAYGLLNAATEIGTEWMSGGVPGLKGTAGTGLDGLFEKYVLKEGLEETSKSLSKAIIKGIYKKGMEGVEEMVSEFISPFIKQFTYQYDENGTLKDNFKNAVNNLSLTDIIQAGIVGSFTSFFLDGVNINDMRAGIQNQAQLSNAIAETINQQENMLGRQLTAEEAADVKNKITEAAKKAGELTPKQTAFTFDEKEARKVKSDKQNVIADDVVKYKLNDEKSNHDLVNLGLAIQSKNDTHQIHIITSEGFYEMGMIKKDANGNYVSLDGSEYIPRGVTTIGNEVYINADVGTQSGTQAMYHELFESFKNSAPSEYKTLKQMVTNIVGEKTINAEVDDYYNRYKDYYKESFKNMTDEQIRNEMRDEIINDKFGELAEDEKFINKICDDRNIFEKFIDSIKDMIRYVKGTEQERQLIKLKKNLETEFAKRYKATDFSKVKNKSRDTAFSITEIKGKNKNYGKGVLLDSNIFENANETQRKQILKDFVYNNLAGQTIEVTDANGKTEQISFAKANERIKNDGSKNAHPILKDLSKKGNTDVIKNLSVVQIDELLQTSKDVGASDINTHKWLDANGWEYKNTILQDRDGNIYQVTLNIGKASDGRNILYDLSKIKKVDTSIVSSKKGLTQKSTSGDIVSQNEGNVNTKNARYSLATNKDSDGDLLTKGQQEYFKDSKVVDSNGNLMVVYHGSHNEYTTYEGGGFFTDDYFNADGYAGGEVVDAVYLNMKNPLIIDCEGKLWRELDTPYGDSTRQIAGYVENSDKYDGVIFNNVADSFADDVEAGTSTVYYIKESNQAKRIDNENPTDNIDTRFSLAKDNKGRQLSEQQETFFKDSKVRDDDGNLLELYHGTTGGEFTVFNKEKGNVENDFGRGFYFTNNESDVEANYVDGGPDFDNRVSRLAERIEQEENISYEEAEEKARKQLYVGGGKFTVYLNMKNPAYVDSTRLFNIEDYSEDIENDLAAEAEYLTKDIEEFAVEYFSTDDLSTLSEEEMKEARDEYLREYGIYDEIAYRYIEDDVDNAINAVTNELEVYDTDELRRILTDNMYDGGVKLESLKDMINTQLEITNENGDLANNEAVRIILESLGYDGIIDKTVSNKFSGMHLDSDTTHYIVFNSNQIKNIDNLNPTTNEDIRFSLATNKDDTGRTLSQQQQSYFKDSKVVDDRGNLMTVYHGGKNTDINIFDITKAGKNGLAFGNGFYFTNNRNSAVGYAGGEEGFVKEGYLNIKKPANYEDITITQEDFNKLYDALKNDANMYDDEMGMPSIDALLSDYGDIYTDINKAKRNFYIWNNESDVKLLDALSYISNPTEFYKVLRDTLGYDGIIIDEPIYNNKTEHYYIAFNSDQFKNADNLNPTTSDDIRESLTSNKNIESKEIAPVKTIEETIAPIREDISNISKQMNDLSEQIKTLQNQPETASDNEIAPYNPYRARAIAQNEANQAIEEMQKDENYWKQIDELAAQTSDLDEKSARKMSRNIGKELGLKQKQIKDLQDVIQKAFDGGYSLQDIKNELDMQFGHTTVTERNEGAIEAQKLIRQFPIKVSQNIQKDIADYGYWKQGYFGKINFSNKGEAVDVVYAQLNELDSAMFPDDIINPTDQLMRIAEVADMQKKYSVDYEMSPEIIDEAANYIHDTFMETLFSNAMKQQTDLEEQAMQYNERTKDIPIKKKTRQEVRENLQNTMGITTDDLQAGNDIKSFSYQTTTPERVNEKVFGREVGRKINEQTVFFAKHQEAERIRFLNKERAEIADLGIKARSKESALVQQYGEGLLDDVQLAQAVSDVATQEKIKKAARILRAKYDTYLDQINEELVEMGYDAIPKRKDYMRHFQELSDKFSQAGIPFNRQDLNSENLPTDINGMTEFNVPGKNWFASAQRRTGEKTTYDAITGIDGYLEGASNLMYHTETIQRYRALEKLIRDTYGQQHGLDVFGDDLSSEQAMQRIQDIQEGKLSNYAAWLKEQGNALAGKKATIDRGIERALGRRGYTLLNTLKKQVGSNMTGFNVRSALTNFISSTIAASKTNKIAMVKGTVDTIRNIFHDDGFINKSDFLTSRFGSDTLSQKTWQKISNAGQVLMTGSDWFTSNVITRSKFYEGIQKGMTESQAMAYANDFAARVMGDRSKGATAEVFNSKTLGLLTQFQLETNNQWQYMIHDTKMEYQENLKEYGGLKAGATVLFQIGQLAAYSYLFNELFEKLTGSRAAFDIADIFKKIFGLDDDKDKDLETRMQEAASELMDALPFTSLFGSGGRLPIGEMLTPFQTTYDALVGNTNKYGQTVKWKDVGKEFKETIPYYVLPTGYGQIKKTVQGLGMYANEVPGSYTDSGNLRFTADEDTGSMIKNALFGQWADTEAKKYRESGYQTIKANDIPLMRDLGMTSSEFREFKQNMKDETATSMDVDGTTYNKYFDADGNMYWYDKDSRTVYDADMNKTDISIMSLEKANASELKYDYVSNLPVSEDNKMKIFNELFTNTTTDKYGYKKYTDSKNKTYWYDEDNDTLYNSKYNKVNKTSVDGLSEVSESKNMANYKDYGSYAEFDYAYKNPAKYKTMKAIAGYDNYQKYKAELTTIRDNTKEDKKETFKYINSLDLTIPQKAMFLRQYYSTYKKYNKEIVNYVSSLDMDYEDKVEILESLKFKVDKNGNVTWK